MNEHAIYHIAKSNYCFAYDKENVYIRIRCAKGDMDKVTLHYGDKYVWDSEKKEIEMELERSDSYFDYYFANIKCIDFNYRLSYYFKVQSGKKIKYVTEWGAIDEVLESELHLHFFNYPYINENDIHKIPKWVEKAVFYQIFPERFANGDPSLNPDIVEPWDGKPERENFFGGDLIGIKNNVSYLKNLGINAIYLTPVFEATTNHKYDTTDYMKIDPHFGDLKDLKDLVNECHDNGIKVVLDAVFNHSGYGFYKFQDVIKYGKDSIYYDWFYIKSLPITTNPISYQTFGTEPKMPKLNTQNPEVVSYLIDVAKYWIQEADIDGWRLDVANEIDHKFWRIFRKEVKAVKEDAYILGEIWHNSINWLGGDQFDGTMNYPFTRACLQYFAYGNIKTNEFKELINNTIVRYTKQANQAMLNILDSHDTPRFITECGGHKDKFKLAVLFQLSYEGAPSIYYGSEIGLEGANDPDCRKTMIWDEDKWDADLLEFYKKVIYIRTKYNAVSTGNLEWIENDKVLTFIKKDEDNTILFVINNSDKKHRFSLPNDTIVAIDLYGKDDIKKIKRSYGIDPYEFRVYKLL